MKRLFFTFGLFVLLSFPFAFFAASFRPTIPFSDSASASDVAQFAITLEHTPTPLPLYPGTPLLVLMYHQFLRSRQSDYIVTPEQFRHDLQTLKARGYTPVTTNQVIGYVYNKVALPDKPVLITIDDGHYSQMHYAYPILKDEGFTALCSIVGKFSEHTSSSGDSKNPNYSHLTWSEIAELSASGVFEIGNHTYDMHDYKPRFGISKIAGETDDEYRNHLTQDLKKLQTTLTEQSGVTPNVFAIPFGKYNNIAIAHLQELGFKMILTCNEGITTVRPSDPSTLTLVKRYNRSPSLNLNALLDRVAKTYRKQP